MEDLKTPKGHFEINLPLVTKFNIHKTKSERVK